MVCELSGEALRNTIKFIYNYEKLTFARLKHVLHIGAREARILRLKEESFDELASALDLPLETISEVSKVKDSVVGKAVKLNSGYSLSTYRNRERMRQYQKASGGS